MPFDFFNLSNLAFGNKLTLAFIQLQQKVKEASEYILSLIRNLSIYSQYLNRNYQLAGAPEKGTDGCRVNELYDIISEKVIVNDISYIGGELSLDCMIFNPTTGRITKLFGYTTLKEGYCYFNYSISNTDPARQASFFADDNNSHGVKLFKYSVNTSTKKVSITWYIQ